MEIALSDPNFRFSRTESLKHCAVTSTRMQRFSTARVSASKTLSSGRARHSNPSSMRSGGRIFAIVVEFRQVLHRDDPERLRRHLHVVVETFDGGWQVGRQSEEMLQRVHSPALGADVADLKLVQEQVTLVVQPRGPPEAATGFFRGLRASDLLQRQRQGENSPGKLPGSHGSPRRGPGRVRDGVQPGHAAIRGRAQPPEFTVLSLMTKSVIRSWRWRHTSRLSVCNWSWSCLRSCVRALLCKCTNSSSVFGGRLPVVKALSPRKVVSSLMRWLWNSDAATRPSYSPRLMARMVPFCSKQLAISFTTS